MRRVVAEKQEDNDLVTDQFISQLLFLFKCCTLCSVYAYLVSWLSHSQGTPAVKTEQLIKFQEVMPFKFTKQNGQDCCDHYDH